MTTDKSKPIIEKIEHTPEQKQEIQDILNGMPLKETVEKLEAKGWNVDAWLKRKPSSNSNYRNKLVRKHYYQNGICCHCAGWPDYKILFDVGGAYLKEFYCEKCFKERQIE